MRIYFVRHGESQANILHEISNRGLRHGLTRVGRGQAAALADRLAEAPGLARVYASPILRAVETAIVLAHRLDLDYEVSDALREFDCGVAEGRSDEEAWGLWRGVVDNWLVHGRMDSRIPGGESFCALTARFVPFVERLIRRHGESEEGLVCVSHGGVYSLMLPQVVRNLDRARLRRHGIGYTACIVCEVRDGGLICTEWM